MKQIANPIAVKVGPDISIKNLIKTINELDPDYLPGRITLIPRLGAQSVNHILPYLSMNNYKLLKINGLILRALKK